nr:MAG TPA: hypothetical protein [Caudoviricetes sp.]
MLGKLKIRYYIIHEASIVGVNRFRNGRLIYIWL